MLACKCYSQKKLLDMKRIILLIVSLGRICRESKTLMELIALTMFVTSSCAKDVYQIFSIKPENS